MHTYDMLLIENQKHGHGFLLLPPSVASVLAPVASVHTGYGYGGESGRPTVSIKSAGATAGGHLTVEDLDCVGDLAPLNSTSSSSTTTSLTLSVEDR